MPKFDRETCAGSYSIAGESNRPDDAGAYQMEYRSYINHHRKNRRDGDIPAGKMQKSEHASSRQHGV